MPVLSGAAVIFGLTLIFSLIGLFGPKAFIERSVLRPYLVLRQRQFDRLIASGLVHADLGHLIFNLLTFYFFAFPLERRIGTLKFLLLYFIGLLVSSVGSYFKHRDNPDYATLGASGAISAVLFASIVYFPDQSIFIIPIPIPIPAPLFAVGYLAYTYYSARMAKGRINHDAHLGGALWGLVFVLFTDPGAYAALLRVVSG